MKTLDHEMLISILNQLHIPYPNEFSTLLLYKKREDMIRDLLFMKLEEIGSEGGLFSTYPDWKPRPGIKHDCTLLIPDKKSYKPLSIIELKYGISSFILDRRDLSRRDNVWIEEFISKSKSSGSKNRGIKEDLDRMINTASDIKKEHGYVPTLHQILIIPTPKNQILSKCPPLHKDYLNHNSYLERYGDKYLVEIQNVVIDQFDKIKDTYFHTPEIQFQTGFCQLPLGKAFNSVEVDLVFFVITVRG